MENQITFDCNIAENILSPLRSRIHVGSPSVLGFSYLEANMAPKRECVLTREQIKDAIRSSKNKADLIAVMFPNSSDLKKKERTFYGTLEREKLLSYFQGHIGSDLAPKVKTDTSRIPASSSGSTPPGPMVLAGVTKFAAGITLVTVFLTGIMTLKGCGDNRDFEIESAFKRIVINYPNNIGETTALGCFKALQASDQLKVAQALINYKNFVADYRESTFRGRNWLDLKTFICGSWKDYKEVQK